MNYWKVEIFYIFFKIQNNYLHYNLIYYIKTRYNFYCDWNNKLLNRNRLKYIKYCITKIFDVNFRYYFSQISNNIMKFKRKIFIKITIWYLFKFNTKLIFNYQMKFLTVNARLNAIMKSWAKYSSAPTNQPPLLQLKQTNKQTHH